MAPAKSKKKAPAPAKKAPPKKSTKKAPAAAAKKPAAAAKAAKKAPPPKKAAKKAPAPKQSAKAPAPTGPRACATYEGPVEGCVFTTVRGITGYFEEEHPAATEPAPAKAAKKARAPKRKAKAPAPKKAKRPPAPAGALGKIVGHAGAAIADFLEFGDVRSALCAGAGLDGLHAELSTFDIGLAETRPFLSSGRPAFDVNLRGVLARMPRLKSLELAHQTHVSAATFEDVDLGRVEHLGIRNCFRLSVPDVSSILARSPCLTSLDISQLRFTPVDIEAIIEGAPSLRTLRLIYTQLADGVDRDGDFVGDRVTDFGGISRLELHNDADAYPALWKFRDAGMKVEARCYRMTADLEMMDVVKDNVLQLVGPGIQLAFHAHTEQWTSADVDDRIQELEPLVREIKREINALPPCPDDDWLDEEFGDGFDGAHHTRGDKNVFRVERALRARDVFQFFATPYPP